MFVLENHANHAFSERNGLSRQTTVDNKVVISQQFFFPIPEGCL